MLFLSASSISIMTICCIITAVIQRHHLLMSLLAFEGVILTLVLLTISSISYNELFMAFILLTFAACEASLGLACLISMTRSYGNDHFNSLSLNKC